MSVQHFILTRFNLALWPHDKSGRENRTVEWLNHRFDVFEKCCLPSLANQTCKEFEWILLMSDSTPQKYRDRIEKDRSICPQICPIYVKAEYNRHFVEVFRQVVMNKAKADRVITTYLDNDDCVSANFVEDVQSRLESLPDGSFLNYVNGYQLFADYEMMLKIDYPTNHFISVIEKKEGLKGVYGYGSHSGICRIPGVHIEYVRNFPVWCEVVHKKNVGNDANFLLRTSLVKETGLLRSVFSVEQDLDRHFYRNYFFKFIPRYLLTFVKRVKYRFFGRDWWK